MSAFSSAHPCAHQGEIEVRMPLLVTTVVGIYREGTPFWNRETATSEMYSVPSEHVENGQTGK